MSPEAQQMAMAEACGWKVWQGRTCLMGLPKVQFDEPPTGVRVPDYLNDLNAMHEAEKVLLARHLPYYSAELRTILENEVMKKESIPLADIYEWHATSAQRAEAFLRTIHKWDDSK